jgi:cephalosporin hydroxylase
MNRFWTPILRPLLEAAEARQVIEIGADTGRTSNRLARWCSTHAARADIIDPAPGFDAAAFDSAWPGVARVHLAASLEVLADLPPADVVFVDGDHNWYTVFHEIMLLLGPPEAPRPQPPIIVFHDTGWPWARRDAYYDITRIPPEFRQPHARGQISPHATGWTPAGVNLGLLCATAQGGPRNGVRTAIEDAFAGRKDQFEIRSLGAFFGLTIAIPKARLETHPALAALLADVIPSPRLKPVIDLLEINRIEGVMATQTLATVFQIGQSAAPPPAEVVAERPLQTALSTETWLGIQKGLFSQTYKGRALLLNPFDQFNYLSLIETLRPATILEIGTLQGGRALWMADQLRAFGIAGRILALDIAPPEGISDPLIEVLPANALDLAAVLTPDRLATLPHPWLVIEDAAHTTEMSRAVLEFFDEHLQPGDRIVIEDGNTGSLMGQPEASPPHLAVQGFLAERGRDYRLEIEICDRYGHNMTGNPNGWLRRL